MFSKASPANYEIFKNKKPISNNNLNEFRDSSVYNITIEDQAKNFFPSEKTFFQTKTQKGEKKKKEDLSTTNPFLTCQSSIKNENIKASISNFELQKEISKKSKLKSGNEFDNINIQNDSQHLFGESTAPKNITSIKDHEFSFNKNSPYLSKRDIMNFSKNNVLDNQIFRPENLKRVNKENDFKVIQKWGRDNCSLNFIDHEQFDLSLNLNCEKNYIKNLENESMLIFGGQNQNSKNLFKDNSSNIFKDSQKEPLNLLKKTNLNIQTENSKKRTNFEFSKCFTQFDKHLNTFNQSKGSPSHLDLTEKLIYSISNSMKNSPEKTILNENNLFNNNEKNRSALFSPLPLKKSKDLILRFFPNFQVTLDL